MYHGAWDDPLAPSIFQRPYRTGPPVATTREFLYSRFRASLFLPPLRSRLERQQTARHSVLTYISSIRVPGCLQAASNPRASDASGPKGTRTCPDTH